MKIQHYAIECKRGWWTGCGWTNNPREILWYSSYGEAKVIGKRLEKPGRAPKYGKHRRIYEASKPPPCRVIGKHRGNVLAHS